MTDNRSPRFYLGQDMPRAETVAVSGGVVSVVSACSPERTGNEDAAALIPAGPDTAVLAVADGAGGHSGAADAARAALEAIATSVRVRPTEHELRTAVLDGFEMANESVMALGVGAGTTLAVVEIQGAWVRTYHVGDSGILLTGQRGRLRIRTVDHTPAGHAVASGLVGERAAMKLDDRNLLTNMVGTKEMRIVIGPAVQMAPRDTLLMASDGLFDNVHLDRIVDTVRSGPMPARLDELVSVCRRRMPDGKPDDTTVIVYRRTDTT